MQSDYHKRHIALRVSHNDCQECRADCERQFLRPQWPGYAHITKYLAYVKPRLEAIKSGNTSTDARIWKREFTRALHRRVTLKTTAETGRKYCSGYLSRLRQFPRDTDRNYLRRFAQRGASTLN